jgi:hypothetical protein
MYSPNSGATRQQILSDLIGEKEEFRLDMTEETGQMPEGISQTDHFQFVGRKS